MFYSLTGKVIYTDSTYVAVDCSGVGYKCLTTANTLNKIGPIGSKVTLYTHLNVYEKGADLYGFYEQTELECFKILTTVSGVGPKAGLSILSVLNPEQLALAIATGDTKSITRAQGVGPKIAQRVVLELKDKLKSALPESLVTGEVESAGIASQAGNASEAVSALVMLGYSQSEASVAIAKIDSDLAVEDMIRQALKNLSKQ